MQQYSTSTLVYNSSFPIDRQHHLKQFYHLSIFQTLSKDYLLCDKNRYFANLVRLSMRNLLQWHAMPQQMMGMDLSFLSLWKSVRLSKVIVFANHHQLTRVR